MINGRWATKNENPDRIRIQDLTGIAPWLEKAGIQVNLEREESGRVVGFVPESDEVYRLVAAYQSGPTVDLLDFLTHQRRMRGRLLDLRGDINGHKGNGRNGKDSRF
jgi:hypothetical protein